MKKEVEPTDVVSGETKTWRMGSVYALAAKVDKLSRAALPDDMRRPLFPGDFPLVQLLNKSPHRISHDLPDEQPRSHRSVLIA